MTRSEYSVGLPTGLKTVMFRTRSRIMRGLADHKTAESQVAITGEP